MKKILLILLLLFTISLVAENHSYDHNASGFWNLSSRTADGTDFLDLSGNGNNGTSANSPSFVDDQNGIANGAVNLNGTSDKVTCGNIGNIKTITAWIYPQTDSRSIFDLDGGTTSVELISGTITSTGWTSPTYYVNGVESQTITLNAWNYIGITSSTAESASAFVIGDEASWFDGYVDGVGTYSDEKSADWIADQYRAGNHTSQSIRDGVNLVEDYDFTTWDNFEGTTNKSSNTYTIDGSSGISKSGLLTIGSTYFVNISGAQGATNTAVATSSTSTINSLESGDTYFTILGSFEATEETFYFYSTGLGGDVATFTTFELYEITDATVSPPMPDFWMPLSGKYTDAGADISITDIDGDGTTADCDANSHGLEFGDKLFIEGSTSYNGIHAVATVADANTFTFATTSSTTNETGTGKLIDGTTLDLSLNNNRGTVSGASVVYDGLVNTTAGVAYIPSDVASGSWKIKFNTANTSTLDIAVMADSYSSIQNGYIISILADETLKVVRYSSGSDSDIIDGGSGYISHSTDYEVWFSLTEGGIATLYIKGGSFGWDSWTTVGTDTQTKISSSTYLYIETGTASGDKISNLHINGEPIRLSNATQTSPAVYTVTGNAYEFDGTDDYIDVEGAFDRIESGNSISIGLWCKFTSGVDIKVILYASSPSGASSISYNSGSGGLGYKNTFGTTSSVTVGNTGSSFDLTEWTHVLVTDDGSGTAKMYINGSEISDTGGSPYATILDDAQTVGGRLSSGSLINDFDGQIKDLKIWYQILTEAEIKADYNMNGAWLK